MSSVIAAIAKGLIATFLTEKVIMKLVLSLCKYLAGKSTNTLDDDAVAILQKAYDERTK